MDADLFVDLDDQHDPLRAEDLAALLRDFEKTSSEATEAGAGTDGAAADGNG